MPHEPTTDIPDALRRLSPAALEYARQLVDGADFAVLAQYDAEQRAGVAGASWEDHLAARQFVDAHLADLADALETERRRRNEEMEEGDDPNGR